MSTFSHSFRNCLLKYFVSGKHSRAEWKLSIRFVFAFCIYIPSHFKMKKKLLYQTQIWYTINRSKNFELQENPASHLIIVRILEKHQMAQSTNNQAAYIWSLADLLRGDFKQSQYTAALFFLLHSCAALKESLKRLKKRFLQSIKI